MSLLPPSSLIKAIRVPSGDHTGPVSAAGPRLTALISPRFRVYGIEVWIPVLFGDIDYWLVR